MFEKWTSLYNVKDYPVLSSFQKRWSAEKPFQNIRILDNTPVFRNTLLKYETLLAGGARLCVGRSDKIAGDVEIYKVLESCCIPIIEVSDCLVKKDKTEMENTFDIILDCAGTFSFLNPTFGFVELTRSGVSLFENAMKPVLVADSGEIKKIETEFGTGDGYFRAMAKLGFSDFKNKKLLIFGNGKVGRGILRYALRYGARVTVVTEISRGVSAAPNVSVIDSSDFEKIVSKIAEADFIVTAIGVRHALAQNLLIQALQKSHAVLANMGVEDEFGNALEDSRVLNHKKPLNFILEEPTELKFIDATMALHNVLGLELVKSANLKSGINPLPEQIEKNILNIIKNSAVQF